MPAGQGLSEYEGFVAVPTRCSLVAWQWECGLYLLVTSNKVIIICFVRKDLLLPRGDPMVQEDIEFRKRLRMAMFATKKSQRPGPIAALILFAFDCGSTCSAFHHLTLGKERW